MRSNFRLRRHGPQNGRPGGGCPEPEERLPEFKCSGARDFRADAYGSLCAHGSFTISEEIHARCRTRHRFMWPHKISASSTSPKFPDAKGIFCPWCEPAHRLLAAHCTELGSRPLMVATLKREKHKCTSISSLSTPKSTWFLAPTASPIRQVSLSLLQPPTTVLLPLTATLSAVL